MNYRKLRNTDISVSEVSFGCWTMGGLNWVDGSPNGWANVNEDEITAGIKAGLDAGVNHWDNADVYGNGRAERMLGARFPSPRRRLEKPDHRHQDRPFPRHGRTRVRAAPHSPSMRAVAEESQSRFYRHLLSPPRRFRAERQIPPRRGRRAGPIAKGRQDLRQRPMRLQRGGFRARVPVVKPTVLQSWAHAMDDHFVRPGSPLQKLMEQYQLTFVAFSPLAQGLLLDKFDPAKPPQFESGDHRRGSKQLRNRRIAQAQAEASEAQTPIWTRTEDLAAMALNYLLAMPRVSLRDPRLPQRTAGAL